MQLKTYSPKEIRERSLAELQRGVDRFRTKEAFYKAVGISRQLYHIWRTTSKYGVSAQYVLPLANTLHLNASELLIDRYPSVSSH